jgi:hypothetical protein
LINAAGGQDAFRSQEWWEQQYDKDVDTLQKSTWSYGDTTMQDILKKAMASTSRTSKEELVRTQRDVARGQLATRRLFRGTGGLLSGGQAGTIAKEPTIGAIEAPMLSTSGKLAMENPLGAKRGLK